MKKAFALWLLAALGALSGCYTNPVTGRKYVVITPAAQEREMGAESFTEVKRKEKVSNDAIGNARVQRVGKRIAAAVGDQMPGAQWEFVVFESKEVNAFALPGGKVGVYTGLLALAETDSELAIVMGHEIGHVVARHGGKRMTEVALIGLGGAALAVATDGKYSSKDRELFLLAYGGVSTLGYVFPHSRGDESEADIMGLQYAAKAGFDPAAAITFWQRMQAAQSGAKIPAWMSTHPSDQQRLANLKAAVPHYTALYEANRREE